MKRNKMWAWLEANGYTESPGKVEEGKKAYKRMYHKAYYHKRKEERPRIKITFEPKEYQQLSQSAEAHQQALAPFIRDSALAYLNQTYLIPNEGHLIALKELLASIGYDTQLLAERAERLQEETLHKNYRYLTQWLSRIEKKIDQLLAKPEKE